MPASEAAIEDSRFLLAAVTAAMPARLTLSRFGRLAEDCPPTISVAGEIDERGSAGLPLLGFGAVLLLLPLLGERCEVDFHGECLADSQVM